MFSRTFSSFFGVCLALFLAVPVQAQILSVTGAMTVAPIPNDISTDQFESNTLTYIFAEKQNVLLTADLRVNRALPANFNGLQVADTVIPAGTLVSSYYIHQDIIGVGSIRLEGSVTFAQPILGLIYQYGYMASDPILSSAGTVYGIDRQLEEPDTISWAGNTLTTSWNTTTGSDNMRVIIAALVNVSGRITLQSVVNSIQQIAFTFRPTSGSSFTRTILLNTDGSYSLSNLPAGNYTVSIKGAKWLRKNISVNASIGNVTNANSVLLAGDTNNDNFADVADLLFIINHYNQQKNTPVNNSNYLEAADFNCDDVNDVADLLLIIGNYNKHGDS